MKKIWALALHGGAFSQPLKSPKHAKAHMKDLLETGQKALQDGDSAVSVVTQMVTALEECGYHLAGKGAAANANGKWELDAAIMDGSTRQAGAVAGLKGYKSPIRIARAVMEKTPHILLVGKGAGQFAESIKAMPVKRPKEYYTPSASALAVPGQINAGTVGAVALDINGALAAATSTGGVLNKMPGRVGDSALIGAGTWADERIAISCTGQGEYFIRAACAADISARVRYGRVSLAEATEAALKDVEYLGGNGGLIGVDKLGNLSLPYNSKGMKRASANWKGVFDVSFS